MRGSLRLGRIAGILVNIHWTFALLIIYIIVTNYRKGYDPLQIAWAVVFVLSIFVTVFLHELGHALAARRYHIKTKDITLLPIGGLARLDKMPEKPSEELVVALAGPAVNLVLGFLAGMALWFTEGPGMGADLDEGVNAGNFLYNFFVVNIWLALFNLIPAFPMDGGRVLRALLSLKFQRHVATKIAARIGQVLAAAFVIGGFFYSPFLVFIGIFIFIGAQSEADYTQAQSMLKGFTIKDALMRDFPSINANEKISTAVEILLNGQSKNFLVLENGMPAGTLSRDQLIKGITEAGEEATVSAIMNRHLIQLDAAAPLESAYQRSRQEKVDLMLVMENGQFVGTLDTENILEFIMVRTAMAK